MSLKKATISRACEFEIYALVKPWDLPNTRSKADANKKVVAIYEIKILTSNIKANGRRHFDYLFTPCKL